MLYLEDTAVWTATGLENQGGVVSVSGSTPLSSASRVAPHRKDYFVEDFNWDPDTDWYAEITKTRWGYTAHFTNGMIETPYYHPFRFTKKGIIRKAKRFLRGKNQSNNPEIIMTVRS